MVLGWFAGQSGGSLGDRLDRARRGFWLRAANQVGDGAVVVGRPTVRNEGTIVIGRDLRLSSRPVASHLVANAGARITIGDRVCISYGAAISSGVEVTIGDDVRMGPFVVIMDSDFHVAGDRNAVAEAKPVRIGRGVVIGSRVSVLRGSEIGDGARVQSGSVVSGNIPAGAVVGGVPARALVDAEEVDVPLLVQRVLGLASTPRPLDGPDDLPGWDSLGALKLLLALEETFGVALGEDDMKKARTVGALADVVARAKESVDATR